MQKEQLLKELAPVLDTKPKQATQPRVIAGDKKFHIRPSSHSSLIELSPEGFGALLKTTDISPGLAKRLAPASIARVASEVLKPCTLLIKGDKVIDLTTKSGVHYIEPERVVDTLERTIPKADFQRVLMMPNYTARIETIGVQEKPVTKGDMIRAGALVQFSPLSITRPEVQSYVVRLACTNGATSIDVLRKYDWGGDGKGLWEWLKNSIREAYQAYGAIVERWQAMTREAILPGQRASVLEALLREAHIMGKDAEAVRTRALEEPPHNAYEVMNLLTWATTHVLSEARDIVRAEAATIRFSADTTHRQICPVCRRSQ